MENGDALEFAAEFATDPARNRQALRDEFDFGGPVDRITSRIPADSKDELGIQLADVAAGLIRAMSVDGASGRPLSPALEAAWHQTRASVRRADPFHFPMVSQSLLRRLRHFR